MIKVIAVHISIKRANLSDVKELIRKEETAEGV